MTMQNNSRKSFANRWDDYQPSKSILLWACVATAIATVIIGFSWGGWVTGASSRTMASQAADTARGELAANICVQRFNAAPDAAAQLTALKALPEGYKRRQFVEDGGWATMPGAATADRQGVDGCATALGA